MHDQPRGDDPRGDQSRGEAPRGDDPRGDAASGDAAAALAALEPFLERLLPFMLRRLGGWRGYTLSFRQELFLELRQELQLDCLQHAGEVLALPRPARHSRWFRLAERWIYGQRKFADRVADLAEPAAAPAGGELPLSTLRELLPEVAPRVLHGLASASHHCHNGRCNLSATAERVGLPSKHVRLLWERTANRLGYDDGFLRFWRRRLAEALVAYAQDLLLDRAAVHVLAGERRPDPRGRLRRIRRIHEVLRVRPVPQDLRVALTPFLRCGLTALPEPGQALDQAAALAPDAPAVAAWQFEARLAGGDLRGAAAALRRARSLGLARPAAVLGAVRLCEARRGPAAALARLGRAVTRGRRDDGPLREALARGLAAHERSLRPQGPNASASARPSSPSASGSGTEPVHSGLPPSRSPRR